MKEIVCDKVKFDNKVSITKDKLLNYLHKYRAYILFQPSIYFRSDSTGKIISGCRSVECQGHYPCIKNFDIDFIDKKIIVFRKKYYKALKEFGKDNKFKKLIKCF
jgi:hypothetical protein